MSNALLNLRTEFSVGAAAARTEALLDRAHELRLDSVARVDRGTLLGLDLFSRAAQARGLHPVAGVELELALLSVPAATLADLTAPATAPLVLYAESEAGYRNLIRLVTVAHSRAGRGDRGRPAPGASCHPHGHRGAGRPFITIDDLIQHRSGLIAQSPGPGGEISSQIQRGQADLAEKLALRLVEVFGRSAFYLGVACHGQPEDARLAEALRELSRRTGIATVAAPQVDRLDPADSRLLDLLGSIGSGHRAGGAGGNLPVGPGSHFRSPAEWRRIYRDHLDAWERAAELAARCVAAPSGIAGQRLRYPLPAGRTEVSYVASLCGARLPRQPEYERRFEAELDRIIALDLAGYFLVLWDLHRYILAHDLSPGAGSAPLTSSLVAWLLGITGVDPVAGGLRFEHFLAQAQEGPPPVELRCDPERAAEITAYLEHRYGPDALYHAPRLRTFSARQAVRELGPALSIDIDTVELFARNIPDAEADLPTVLARHDSLAQRYGRDPLVRVWLDLVGRLQGMPRSIEADPGRLILLDGGAIAPAPARLDWQGRRFLEVSAATAPGFLSLRLVCAPLPELGELDSPAPVADPVTEVSLRQVAGHEPALVDRFRRRALGQEPVRIVDGALEPILGRTRGLLLEQEQLLEIAESMAGFPADEAEEFRRVVCRGPSGAALPGFAGASESVRRADARSVALHHWRFRFVEGAVARGARAERAIEIFMSLVSAGPRLASRAESLARVAGSSAGPQMARPIMALRPVVGRRPSRIPGTGRPSAAAALAASADPFPQSCRRSSGPVQLDMLWAREADQAERSAPRRNGTYGDTR